MVSKGHKLSVRRQCALLTLARSNLYYQPKGESAENLQFMGIIDKQFLETPWYGSRQMARHMKRNNHQCGRHRVRRLMRLMRLVPIYQEPNTSKKHPQHKIWPYLLRNTVIDRPNQVWCAGRQRDKTHGAYRQDQAIRHLDAASKEGRNALRPPQTHSWAGAIAITRTMRRK